MKSVEDKAIEWVNRNGKWNHLFIRGKIISKPYPTLFQTEIDYWIAGYKGALKEINQFLNQK